MKILIFLFIVLFAIIDARLFEGQCLERQAKIVSPIFLFGLYIGVWYEIEWYDDEYPTFDECIKFTYTRTSQNEFNMTLDLKNPTLDFASEQYKGHGVLSQPGMLSTTFGTGPPTRVNHQVLATDYSRYAFVWDCANVNATHYNERMWYFDRIPNPSSRPKKVDDLIKKYFDEQYIRKTYQGVECGWNTNCY